MMGGAVRRIGGGRDGDGRVAADEDSSCGKGERFRHGTAVGSTARCELGAE